MSLENLPWSIRYDQEGLTLLDQTLLPTELKFELQTSIEQVYDSIKQLKVRGAPAIGVAGAFGLVVATKNLGHTPKESEFIEWCEYLNSSRPTAVNLKWALDRMSDFSRNLYALPFKDFLSKIEQQAKEIMDEDANLCHSIGKHGRSLIHEGMGILTHCNAGSLAVSRYGTALAPMYLAHEDGVKFKVYADETRPLLQGSRLTAWELSQAGIDVSVITDSMAAHMMSSGAIDLVIVGTDRVAANGDVANKIGTLGVAILAKYFKIPFYVACPSSTLDLNTAQGKDIVIEERGPDEVRSIRGVATAPPEVSVRNPAFDITPHELVSGLITEKGVFNYPYNEKIAEVFG